MWSQLHFSFSILHFPSMTPFFLLKLCKNLLSWIEGFQQRVIWSNSSPCIFWATPSRKWTQFISQESWVRMGEEQNSGKMPTVYVWQGREAVQIRPSSQTVNIGFLNNNKLAAEINLDREFESSVRRKVRLVLESLICSNCWNFPNHM